ncbi:MAG TPA: DNA topoisomerase IV subunit A [Geobacterales bacterium]|nr:DNA topoisomerase IV subunit A [Geobacterales bacterium]
MKSVADKLAEIGRDIVEQIKKDNFPAITFPLRSVSNIVFDEEEGVVKLGQKKVTRRANNIKQAKVFAQLLWIAAFAKTELLEKGRSCSLRDLYYNSFNDVKIKFEDQDESDNLVVELETILEVAREHFNIIPEEKSSIFGDLVIEYTMPVTHRGQRVSLTTDPDGKNIGLSLATAKFVDVNASMVIAIEKGAIFRRFVEEQVYKKLNAILIDTGGQAPRFTRMLIRRLNKELGLPVYVLTDADPWGMHIARVIISGSAISAHIPELATPDAKWLGIYATDIKKFGLPSIPLTQLDLHRLETMKRDPRYEDGLWRNQLEEFSKIKVKAELEAFSKYGLTAIIDKYLMKKIKELK